MVRGSKHPRRRRGLLLAANLLLLVAMSPALVRSQEGRKETDKKARGLYRHDKPREVERPSGSNSESAKPADDDDAGDAAGAVAAGCCAGFIGALADSEPNDPSDVDRDIPPAGPVGEQSLGPEPVTPVAFDRDAAKRALRQASKATKGCEGAEDHNGKIRATVIFVPGGTARAVKLDPKPTSEALASCARANFMAAEVPPFEGDEVGVSKSFELP